MSIPYILTGNSVTVYSGGNTYTALASHPSFEAIKEALKDNRPADDIVPLFNVSKALALLTEGRVSVVGDGVFFDGREAHSSLTTRMLAMLRDGYDIAPLMRFLDRLMDNPSHRAVTGLYDFLAAANIPITPEGKFLAYKKVRSDFFDIHSGTIRNAPGDTPRVNRNQVDEDPDQTCSYGLHVCSESYLPHFGRSDGDKVVVVEVDPADVVAIPRDYNNAKMRVCGYRVIAEVPKDRIAATFSRPVMGDDDFGDDSWDYDFGDDDDDTFVGEVHEVVMHDRTFVFERDGADYWTVSWEDGDDSHDLGYYPNLDEAKEAFDNEAFLSVSDWIADVRWLNDDGSLGLVVVGVTSDSEPEDWEFIEEAIHDERRPMPSRHEHRAVVVNKMNIPTSARMDFVL